MVFSKLLNLLGFFHCSSSPNPWQMSSGRVILHYSPSPHHSLMRFSACHGAEGAVGLLLPAHPWGFPILSRPRTLPQPCGCQLQPQQGPNRARLQLHTTLSCLAMGNKGLGQAWAHVGLGLALPMALLCCSLKGPDPEHYLQASVLVSHVFGLAFHCILSHVMRYLKQPIFYRFLK